MPRLAPVTRATFPRRSMAINASHIPEHQGAFPALPVPAYDRVGSGPPLLLVHGLGGERHIWRPVLDRLAAEHDLVTVDLPGFGESQAIPSGAHPPTPARLAASIAGLLDELGWDRPAVAGNSLGGWVGLELAALGRAGAVTGIAPAGMWTKPLAPKPYLAHHVARTLRWAIPTLMKSERLRHAALSGSVAHPHKVPVADAVRMILAYARAPDFVAVNDAMRADRFDEGHRIDVPVTLAWCERDRLVARPPTLPLAVARELHLPDCGHVPMYDDPDLIAQVILQGSRTP